MTILKPSHIDQLFKNKPIGDQALFEHKLDQWKQNILYSYKPSILNSSHKTMKMSRDRPKVTQQPEENEFRTTAVIVPQLTVTPSAPRKNMEHHKSTPSTSNTHSSSFNSHPPKPTFPATPTYSAITLGSPNPCSVAKPPCMALVPVRYNLRQILEETSGGQMIMSYYEKHKILREEHRTALINVIARYIDTAGYGLTLSESTQLEAQIVEMFPTEKAEFYRTNKRGRIYNKVANMKRVYKKFSMTPEETMQAPPSIENTMTSAPSSPTTEIISKLTLI